MKIAITINEILIPKKLFSAKLDKELEYDSALPDYCPDIARLIKVDCTPFTENCNIENGKATVNGKAVYDVLYETDYKNRLRCCTFTQDFSLSVPVPSGAENPYAFCNCSCEKISCKLLSPRRLLLKSSLSAAMTMEGDISAKALNVTDGKDIFFRKKTIGFEGRTSLYTENFHFSDSLGLAQSEKSIGEIVCGTVTLQPPQTVYSPSRAEIKTTALIHALCEEENNEGKYFMALKSIPVNIELQNDAIEDFKHISAELEATDIQLSPELDQYGESRMIKASFSVTANLKINEPKAFTVADDMFEKDFDSTLIKGTTKMPQLFNQTESGFSAEGKLPVMNPKPETILDANSKDYGAIIEKAEGGINVSGNFITTLLTETQEGIFSFDHSVPYNQFVAMEFPESGGDISAKTYPVETIATLHSDGSATARIIAITKITVCNETEETFVSEVSKRIPREAVNEGASLVYCFPQQGENLWSVAKLYRASPDEISKANPKLFDESGAIISNGEPILIKS